MTMVSLTLVMMMMVTMVTSAVLMDETHFTLLHALALPASAVHASYAIRQRCQCSAMCRVYRGCQASTLEEQNHALVCHLSLEQLDVASLEMNGNSFTFYRSGEYFGIVLIAVMYCAVSTAPDVYGYSALAWCSNFDATLRVYVAFVI
ncbi:uncharacterized protein [Penaeus vannamei]|uniref:uncharacterized protein n=1 Tax=Penaeus vannamei TaxID=6689 RepID=UPI00387F6B57